MLKPEILKQDPGQTDIDYQGRQWQKKRPDKAAL